MSELSRLEKLEIKTQAQEDLINRILSGQQKIESMATKKSNSEDKKEEQTKAKASDSKKSTSKSKEDQGPQIMEFTHDKTKYRFKTPKVRINSKVAGNALHVPEELKEELGQKKYGEFCAEIVERFPQLVEEA